MIIIIVLRTMSAVTADCAGNYRGCSRMVLASGRGGGVTVMLRADEPKSAPWHHLTAGGTGSRSPRYSSQRTLLLLLLVSISPDGSHFLFHLI